MFCSTTFLLLLAFLVTNCAANLPLGFEEKPRNTLMKNRGGMDLPFVPEDYRVVPKFVFNKDDFVSQLPSQDEVALSAAILTLLIDDQNSTESNGTKVYNNLRLIYVGKARLGGRAGQFAHFAATVEVQICDQTLSSCHYESCDLDLDQEEAAIADDNYHLRFTVHSKHCSRLDTWCHHCNNYNSDDLPVEGPNKCHKSGQGQQLNCNLAFGDLAIRKSWACSLTYTMVAGETEVVKRGCIQVDAEKVKDRSRPLECRGLDDSDYETECVCFNGSSCNSQTSFEPSNVDPVVKEINKSLRQLRADMKRTIQRYRK